jgi:hypothetical protein
MIVQFRHDDLLLSMNIGSSITGLVINENTLTYYNLDSFYVLLGPNNQNTISLFSHHYFLDHFLLEMSDTHHQENILVHMVFL